MDFKSLIVGALFTIIFIYVLKLVMAKANVPVVSATLGEVLP